MKVEADVLGSRPLYAYGFCGLKATLNKGRNGSPRLAHQADKRRQSSLDIIVSRASNYRRVQELCESRGGRLGLSVLMSLTVSVDVKEH